MNGFVKQADDVKVTQPNSVAIITKLESTQPETEVLLSSEYFLLSFLVAELLACFPKVSPVFLF